MPETCGHIVVRRWQILGERTDHYLPECIRPKHHDGEHVFKTPEAKLFAWEYDLNCECCNLDDDPGCYTYWKVEASEYPDLILEQT